MAIKTTESGTTLRNRLARPIVLAIRTLMQQGNPDEKSLDMAAYIVLALEKINETIDTAVLAWERRDYWVKADQFRQRIATEAISVGQRFSKVKIAEKNRIGEPWVGAWDVLKRAKH